MSPVGPRCPACAGASTAVVFEASAVPVLCNAFANTREEALGAPVGDVELAVCRSCAVVWNTKFDPELAAYSTLYENSLHFSPAFSAYAETLATQLVDRYDLNGANVLEIGPGSGDFLALLRRAGVGRCIGFDPSHDGARATAPLPDGVEIRAESYPVDRHVDADMVVCRHVLEHVTEPERLVAGVRASLDPNRRTAVYFEVPDADYMFAKNSFFDVVYEHHTYFGALALRTLFEKSGYDVLDIGSSFGGQYLWIEAVGSSTRRPPATVAPAAIDDVVAQARAFGDSAESYLQRWSELLASSATGSVAVWGAGSKGVMFLNTVPGARDVAAVVDLNPHKQGLYVPGTGQQVVAPEALVDAAPTTVIVMNPLYAEEVASQLAALGVTAEVRVA